jgi:hypothetical protein
VFSTGDYPSTGYNPRPLGSRDIKNTCALASLLAAMAVGCIAVPRSSVSEEPKATADAETWAGTLREVGSYAAIYYVGKESGDLAIFYFEKSSTVGRRILAVCQPEHRCEFSGSVSVEKLPPQLNDEYAKEASETARILKISRVRRVE